MELGRAIHALRIRRGLKQQDLAKAAQVSIGQISNVERGEYWPSLPTLVAIADVLDVRVGDIFRFEASSDDSRRAAEQARLLAMTSSLSPEEITWLLGVFEAALKRPGVTSQVPRRSKTRD
jgi:transcriptional regulator with XRE-family HTH domain